MFHLFLSNLLLPSIHVFCADAKEIEMSEMFDKQALVIGGGGCDMRAIWPDASSYGIQIVLVDSNIDCLAKDQVCTFIHVDFTNHTEDSTHAVTIVSALQSRGIKVDGCIAFLEDCVPLAAAICDILGLKGVGLEAAKNVKRKSSTQMILRQIPKTSQYTSPVHRLRRPSDLAEIPTDFVFPAILKPEYGNNAFGATKVTDLDAAKEEYKKFTEVFKSEKDFPLAGLGFGNDMLLMEFINGSEHDIDIIIFNERLVAAVVSDIYQGGDDRNWAEVCSLMPSSLSPRKVQELVSAAFECCIAVGLKSGAFNIEFKVTTAGPKLIEINGRIGGRQRRNWIRRIYNIDTMLCAMMIACGECPNVPEETPVFQLAGINILPSLHRHIFDMMDIVKRLEEKQNFIFIQYHECVNDAINGKEESFGSIAVIENNIETAKAKLLEAANLLKIDSYEYPVEKLLAQKHQE